MNKKKPYNSFYYKKKRLPYIARALVLVGIAMVSVVAAWQIDTIREFFSRASGEPANIMVDTQAVLGPMPRPWRNLAQGGEEANWRIQPIAGQVAALNPEYIRIDHIYDFYEIVQGEPGNLTFDFAKFDLLLDDIIATGAKPYIALSYTPPAIATGDIVSEPRDYAAWQQVVERTIAHVSGTRGIRDVYYEVWNEPDLFGGWKYYGDKNYLRLYGAAAQGAARAQRQPGVQPFKIGGPATTALYKNWYEALARYATENNLRLDFLSWHRYSNNTEQYREDMLNARQWLTQFAQYDGILELHITEWGHDSENHAGYDGGYGAAHTVAGAIEMAGVVERAFVFEIQDGKGPDGQQYWGRWGLITHNDAGAVAKPRYWGLHMLDSIADQRLQLLGKGTWVKALAGRTSEGGVEVVLANHDPQGNHSENVPITFNNIQPGNYTIVKKLLSGGEQTEQVATTEAALKTMFTMPANSVGRVELRGL